MLKALHISLAIIVVCLSVYGFITGNHETSSYMLLFLGLMCLVMGVSQFKEKRKSMGVILFVTSFFALFVLIYTI
ncbi:YczI family protein [Terribacillus sp. 179-K 1B1 HS]|uniref:YczI family protein n=1 Tax=Terribacillus sp. 179-K 1B1 HS TaxID=3142388 RepID=UPI0039A21262